MTDRGADDLTYDPQQRLRTYTTPGVDDTYTYTTTNQRLIREHGTTITLYLAGMEATWDGTTTTITRYPNIAGATIATHTTVIGGSTSVAWNCGNMQNSTTCQAPAPSVANPPIPGRKRYTPYGGDRNTTPYTNTDHGYLGQPEDASGLTYLNNRYYDSGLATFIAVDPLVATTGTPYLYGNGNPTTFSDPSGLQCVSVDGEGCMTGSSKRPPATYEDAVARSLQSGTRASYNRLKEARGCHVTHVGVLGCMGEGTWSQNSYSPFAEGGAFPGGSKLSADSLAAIHETFFPGIGAPLPDGFESWNHDAQVLWAQQSAGDGSYFSATLIHSGAMASDPAAFPVGALVADAALELSKWYSGAGKALA